MLLTPGVTAWIAELVKVTLFVLRDKKKKKEKINQLNARCEVLNYPKKYGAVPPIPPRLRSTVGDQQKIGS